MKKINVHFHKDSDLCQASSNFQNEGMDLIELLLFDLNTIPKINEFQRIVFIHHKSFGTNVTSIKYNNNYINIIADIMCEEDEKVPSKQIQVSVLKEILKDWKSFLKNKKEVRKEYLQE